jgi:hypothetical protein
MTSRPIPNLLERIVATEERHAEIAAAAKTYVRARAKFLRDYNRAEAREELDKAWSELAALFPQEDK